jgi:hypothetical protein
MDEFSQEQLKALEKNERVTANRTCLEEELIHRVGSHNKVNLDSSNYLPTIQDGIQRARELDRNPNDRWPQSLGTRVYLLAERLMRAQL